MLGTDRACIPFLDVFVWWLSTRVENMASSLLARIDDWFEAFLSERADE